MKNGGKYNGYMKNITESGNQIALHSYSHDYPQVYASEQAFFDDLQKISDLVYNETGVRTNIFRFPGGSSNTISRKYSPGIMTTLTKEVQEKDTAILIGTFLRVMPNQGNSLKTL